MSAEAWNWTVIHGPWVQALLAHFFSAKIFTFIKVSLKANLSFYTGILWIKGSTAPTRVTCPYISSENNVQEDHGSLHCSPLGCGRYWSSIRRAREILCTPVHSHLGCVDSIGCCCNIHCLVLHPLCYCLTGPYFIFFVLSPIALLQCLAVYAIYFVIPPKNLQKN